MKKVKSFISSTKTKAAVSLSALALTVMPTFCTGITQLDNAKEFVFTLAKWAGGIIAFIGLCALGKAFMDSTSGQSQPGAIGKGLGLLVLGGIMLGGSVVIGILGG